MDGSIHTEEIQPASSKLFSINNLIFPRAMDWLWDISHYLQILAEHNSVLYILNYIIPSTVCNQGEGIHSW